MRVNVPYEYMTCTSNIILCEYELCTGTCTNTFASTRNVRVQVVYIAEHVHDTSHVTFRTRHKHN